VYKTRIDGTIYLIDGYVTDVDGEYGDADDLLALVSIQIPGNDSSLLYYHPGETSDVKRIARFIYRAIRTVTARTPLGRLYNLARLATKVDVVEDLFFGRDHPAEGYYYLGQAKERMFRGKLYAKFITPDESGE